MTKKLILAEKPSVGLTYAALLGADRKFDGYMEGTDCIVTWCFGHLAELASPETYDEKYAKWNRSDLPIVPQNWILKPSREKKKQFEIIKTLMHREDVSEVINACDAGREGELIFRYVYELAKCRKPMKRLWISSMEDEAIMDGFRNLRSGSDFDSLYQAALCRAKADWLVGMNATRLFSVLYHRTLNVGRVVSPTLALIIERDTEIKAFKPQPYYTVCSDFEGFSAVSGKYTDKTEAETTLHTVNHAPFTVKSVERKEKHEKAPALYDLTTLQRDANRLLGYTAQQTLDYLQSLYEKKLTTYPRTDSRYLTDDMKDTVNSISLLCAGILNTDRRYHPDTESVCNSRKVSDHHAIIPTLLAGTAELDDLPNGEREILRLIARQVLLATAPACEYAETLVTLDCNGVSFTAKGKTVLDMGWKSYLDNEPTEKVLPDLTVGMTLTTETCTIRDGKTKAPAAYTEDTLLHAMETAGGKETDDDVERKGIGTPATRAAMIEKLISAGYVERRKNSLVPAPVGNSLITVLPEQLQSPLLTAEWENKLKQIERGEMEAEVFLSGITDMLRELFESYTAVPGSEVLFPSGRTVVGRCPRCGSDVTESRKGFFCEKNECRFGLWRDNKYLENKRIDLTRADAEALLRDGRVHLDHIYSEKTDSTYAADLLMEDNGERTVYRIDFGRRT